MGGKSIYRKLFFIFNQEDAGFGAGQSPTGYVKIEARDGKGKLSTVVQNLKEDTKSLVYKLYIIKCTEKDFVPVFAGTIPLNKNKGELQWEFSSENIANSNISIDDINTAAVIAEHAGRMSMDFACPLAAYKDSRTLWREKLKEKLYRKVNAVPNEIIENKSENILNNKIEDSIQEISTNNVHNAETGPAYSENADPGPEAEGRAIKEVNTVAKGMENPKNQDLANTNIGNYTASYEEYRDMVEKAGHHYTFKNNDTNMPCGNIGCSYITESNGINPCTNCFMRKSNTENTDSGIQGDVDKLRKDLDRCFEICDPFRSRRRDYKWWKVNSPVHLNNVLFQCNIKTPVLFNPKILMSHFKYRHLIFGIYSDTVRHKEYVVFGVPGVYSVDDRPFKDICRWAQVEGNKPRYGAFGYWLVYIDPKTGKIV